MAQTRFALILYFRMMAHKSTCHTLLNAILKSMLKVPFTQDSEGENLFCGASPGSEPSLFFSNTLVSLGLSPFKIIRKTGKAHSSVILTELQVSLFRKCNNQKLSPWVGHSPVFQILLQILVKTSTMVAPPA